MRACASSWRAGAIIREDEETPSFVLSCGAGTDDAHRKVLHSAHDHARMRRSSARRMPFARLPPLARPTRGADAGRARRRYVRRFLPACAEKAEAVAVGVLR